MVTSLISLFSNTACEKHGFFGLTPWYHYLPDSDFSGCDFRHFQFLPSSGSTSIGGDVPLVILAIVDDLLRVAGMVAIVFVIVGAFRYVRSQGSPDEAAAAQSTIVNALIGMVIAIVAASFVSFLGNKLGG